MKIKSNVKAGGQYVNHNETMISNKKSKSLTIKTGVKAGGISWNHNETMVHDIE
jgi:hypothetical protein